MSKLGLGGGFTQCDPVKVQLNDWRPTMVIETPYLADSAGEYACYDNPYIDAVLELDNEGVVVMNKTEVKDLEPVVEGSKTKFWLCAGLAALLLK